MKKKEKKKKGYVGRWENRAYLAQQAWQGHMAKSEKKMLLNMSVAEYATIFPDSAGWVKKFARMFAPPGKKIETNMKQLCKKIGYEGKNCLIEDFSMWACLFADPAFTRVSVEELEDLAPAFEAELKKSRKDVNMWPHPAVVLQKARENAKDIEKNRKREEVAAPAAKKTGKKKSIYKHVFWHAQSGKWRAMVHYEKKTGKRQYAHFEKEADAANAVKKFLNKTSEELLKKTAKQYEDVKTASMYEGVFYDAREAYSKKWMAVAWVKKPGQKKLQWKGIGHFRTQLEAAKAMAVFKKVSVKELRKLKAKIYEDKHAMGIAGRRFQILTSVFVNRNGLPAVPGDYEASKEVAKDARHKKMFKQEAATAIASIGLKYGPCKKDLLEAWQASGKRSGIFWEAMVKDLQIPA